MFHVELRQFPHLARALNLSAEELEARIVARWVRGDIVEIDERGWAPERARLTIYEGPALRGEEIGLGRGWSNAVRTGEDVTERVLDEAKEGLRSTGVESSVARFKQEVLDQCAAGRIGVHQVLWLATEKHPGWRVSDRLALAERAVWELLHEHRLTMLRANGSAGDPGTVAQDEWQAILLAWATWADPRGPSVLLQATAEGST
jgi:hypothetical protein